MIALAIALAVTMMQNDARIATGLTRSYEVSGQELTAKLIVATAESSMVNSFETSTNAIINGLYVKDCTGIADCGLWIKGDIEGKINNTVGTDAISGLRKAFTDALGGDSIVTNEEGMNSYIRSTPGAIGVNIDQNLVGKINIGPDGASVFYVTFTDNYGNTMKVGIVPHGFSYTYGYPIGNYSDTTVNLLDLASKNDITDFAPLVNGMDASLCGENHALSSFTASKTADGISTVDASWTMNSIVMEMRLSEATETATDPKSVSCSCDIDRITCA